MKAFILQTLIAVGLTLPVAASDSVTVNATTAVKVAWVESGSSHAESETLRSTFCPVFRSALESIYGEETEIIFTKLSTRQAGDRLMRGQVDAVLQFAPRVSGRIRRAGGHVLQAESITRPGRYVSFLVLPKTQPKLETLLAQAFSVSINNFDVRRVLDGENTDQKLAAR